MDALHAAALDRAISPDRFGTYLNEAGDDVTLARQLYLWDRDVASALLRDIAIVEVAMRNALSEQLTLSFGAEWYRTPGVFDKRSAGELATAWNRLPKLRRTPGRLVAQLMFGFWVGLLDTGGVMGNAPQDHSADYEALWRRTLRSAFPGGRLQAVAIGHRYSRAWVHGVVTEIQNVRNRAAHHEPLLRGIPLNGQKMPSGLTRRISVQEGHDQIRRLAAMIDRDLLAWLDQTTQVPAILTNRPTNRHRGPVRKPAERALLVRSLHTTGSSVRPGSVRRASV